MNYKDMNLFDIASVIQNLMFDDDVRFSIQINGQRFNCCQMEANAGEITLKIDFDRIKIIPLDEYKKLKETK